MTERTQDIYNADELNELLAKTVITRTFEEITGKEIRRIHQVPLQFLPEERAVYRMVMEEFYRVQREYFASTGNHRKDAMLRLVQQITLAAPGGGRAQHAEGVQWRYAFENRDSGGNDGGMGK